MAEWRLLTQNNKLKHIEFNIDEEKKKIQHCNRILAENKHWVKSQARTLTHFLENLIARRLSRSFIKIQSVIIFNKELVIKLFSKFGHKNILREKKAQALGILREFSDIQKLRDRREQLNNLKGTVEVQREEICKLGDAIDTHTGLYEKGLALNFVSR